MTNAGGSVFALGFDNEPPLDATRNTMDDARARLRNTGQGVGDRPQELFSLVEGDRRGQLVKKVEHFRR